jgi:hypothetical protein
VSILEVFKEDQYRIGSLQVIPYDRKRDGLFHEGYIGDLYFRMKGDRFHQTKADKRIGTGVLENLFCGMSDVSYDAIVPYLAARPLLIFGEWVEHEDSPEDFEPAGLMFPVTTIGSANTERSVFVGYTMFRPYWGKPEAEVLGMLGLAYFFVELNVQAVLGVRYDSNSLTARFAGKYGVTDVGWIPKYMVRHGKLVGAVVSALLKEDFEKYVERQLLEAFQNGRVTPDPVPDDSDQDELPLLFPDIP